MHSPPHRPNPLPIAGLGWRHPHYEAVLTQRPPLAFLEVHSENFFGDGGAALQVLAQGRALAPVSLHGVGLSLGSACGLDPWHLDRLAQLVARIDPVRVSDHVCFARAPWGQAVGSPPAAGTDTAQAVHAADLLPLPLTHEALAVMVRHVQQVQERLQRPLAVEHLSAYLQWAQADWSEPDFLTELSRRSGCHLLVDVNNLLVNAQNAHGIRHPDDPRVRTHALPDARAWLDALGADVPVAELHLAGHTHTDTLVIDDHGRPVCDAVWALYRHALNRWGPVPTAVEWDTDVPELPVLLAEMDRANALAQAVQTQPTAPEHPLAPMPLGTPA